MQCDTSQNAAYHQQSRLPTTWPERNSNRPAIRRLAIAWNESYILSTSSVPIWMPITSSLIHMPKIHIAAGLAPIDAPTRWLSLSKTPWQPRNNGHLIYKHTGHTTIMEAQMIHIGMQNSELHIRYVIRTENFKRIIKFRTFR